MSHHYPYEISRDLGVDPALCLAHSQLHAQYIKQDNDGRRTAGESQPGIVNKTDKTVFYLQKLCRLFYHYLSQLF